MKVTLRRIISLLLVLPVSGAVLIFAASANYSESCTVETNDLYTYATELSRLIAQTPVNGTRSEKASDTSDGYESMRVIARSKGDSLSLSGYDTLWTIKGPDDIYILQFSSEASARECVRELSTDSRVKYAEPDYPVSVCETSDVPISDENAQSYTHMSWGPDYIESDVYNNYIANSEYKDNSSVVAIVDSGIAYHSVLDGITLDSSTDLTDTNDPRNDGYGHGTHVAGIIADCTQGLNVNLMSVKVLNSSGKGDTSVVAAGIKYAVENGADIINYSISGDHSQTKDDAVEYAVSNGVSFVCATGNRGCPLSETCPGHLDSAIVVGALMSDGGRNAISCYGSTLDVMAPGTGILSCSNESYTGTVSKTGTSMATPFISAIAAMYKLVKPTAEPDNVETFVKGISTDLGDYGFDIYFGHGVPKLSSAVPGNKVEFEFTDYGVSITRVSECVGLFTVPSSVNGIPVVSIGSNAFNGCTGLKEVILPEGIKSIHDNAFEGCEALDSVTLPDSLVSIGKYAFLGCSELERVRIPASVDYIGTRAFGFSSRESAASYGFTVEGYESTIASIYAQNNSLTFVQSTRPQIVFEQDELYLAVGGASYLKYTVYPIGTAATISYHSSNSSVLVCESYTGELSAKASGTATVLVNAATTSGSCSDSVIIVVKDSAMTLSQSSIALYSHEQVQLTTVSNLPQYESSSLTFSSEDSDIASVSSDGTVITNERGTTIILVSTPDGKYAVKCPVTVTYTLQQWIIIILFFGWIWYV